jgi:tetratricopeptide (TPR) repeat protein
LVISKESYHFHLENLENLGHNQEKALLDVLGQFPYCQTSHILYLKCLQNSKSLQFNHQLKRSAIHISDRKKLFHLIIIKNSDSKNNIKAETKIEKSKKNPLNIGKLLEFTKQEEHSFLEWLKLSDTKKINRNVTSKLDSQINLIEKFIGNKPKIKSDSLTFYSPNNQAKKSVQEKMDFVTETLARVYLEQGHYDKAKKAYEQLCLKYPQKSSLFAEKIEMINNLISKN